MIARYCLTTHRTIPSLALLFLVLVAATSPGRAQGISGISYTLTPSIETIRWDSDLGLEDTELYGATATMNFGKYLGLQGLYYLRNGVQTDLADTGLLGPANQPLVDQKLDLRNYGVNVIMNLSTGSVVPFLKAGAGVMRFDTDDGDETSQINFKVGGGLRFGIDRVRATVWVEDSAVRMDRYHLAANAPGDPAFPVDPEVDKLRHNLAVGAGIDISLGGYKGDDLTEIDRAVAERFRAGLKGMSIPIEVFAGSISFDDGAGLADENIAGVRTGLDFGRHFGLRGYYWQGMSGGFDGTDPLHSYGGEAQFNLNAGEGAIPYLLVGAGHLEFEDKYEEEMGVDPADKTMLILGGGLFFSVGDRVRVNLAVRDYLFSERDFEDVTATDQLTSNIAFTAGATISLGGGGARSVKELRDALPAPSTKPVPPEEFVAPPPEDALVAVDDEPRGDADARSTPGAPGTSDGRSYQSERQVTVPVPEQGEIYIRYGQPGGVQVESRFEGRETTAPAQPSAPGGVPAGQAGPAGQPPQLDEEALRQVIREELEAGRAAQPAPPTAQPTPPAGQPQAGQPQTGQPQAAVPDGAAGTYTGLTTDQQLELLERRLAEQIEQRVDDRMKEVEQRQQTQSPPTVIVQEDGTQRRVATTAADQPMDDGVSFSPRTLEAVVGANVDEPEQMILGARLDLGPIARDSRLHLVPQLDLGFFGDGTSVMPAANLRYELSDPTARGAFAPYVMFGAGILIFADDVADRTDQEGVLNLGYGVAANMDGTVFFLEHQGVDLFDLNRVLLGVRWGLGN